MRATHPGLGPLTPAMVDAAPTDGRRPDPQRFQAPRILIVSASDTRFLSFLKGMLHSIGPALALPNVDLACFDIGLTEADRSWLAGQGARIAVPGAHFGLRAADYSPALRSFLARPFLREYFPGYDAYVWIDSDIWLQDQNVLDRYVDGALKYGMAVTHEREQAYRFQPWLFGWTAKHFVLGYGVAGAAFLLTQRHLNAGFFAIRGDAPHWDAWAGRYEAAVRRTRSLVPHDQFALNQALHGKPFSGGKRLAACFLDPGCNWICDRGVPMWNDALGVFCRPYPPYEAIGALHLAGPAKRTAYTVRRTGGSQFDTYLLQGSGPDSPVLKLPQPAVLPVTEAAA